MPTEVAVAIFLFAALVVGTLSYVVVRLLRDPPPTDLSLKAQRLARLAGYPKFMDGLFARQMTGREKMGCVVVAIIVVLAIMFTEKR